MNVAISLRLATEDWEQGSAYVVEAERLGAHSVWTPEAWGHDAVAPLAFLAARTSRILLGTAIMQAGTRTPALIAMTALSLASMSHGRFRLGLGVSGPQVIEGWHGIRFDRPVRRLRGSAGRAPSPSPTTSGGSRRRASPGWRSVSARWARAGTPSTTTPTGARATRTSPPRSSGCGSTAGATRRRRACPTSWCSRPTCSAPRRWCASGWLSTAPRGSRRFAWRRPVITSTRRPPTPGACSSWPGACERSDTTDLNYSPEETAFRDEVRGWIAAKLAGEV